MSEEVELSLPAKPELLSLARLTVAAIASRADFDYEEIEDLRLAIDELCSHLVGHQGRPGQLRLRYQWGDGALEVSCLLDGGAPGGLSGRAEPDEGELSDRILDALVDEHGHDSEDAGHRAWLRKRRRGATH